ncbi:MAG TPA: hypothetical protein VJ553_04780 [Candidatus Paceibacterota bacterium]|nr:hypothetical protein [Candidatus Paceibacterota bacterium]
MPIDRSQNPGAWFRVPGLTLTGSYWSVSFSVSSAFEGRLHWLIAAWHCFDVVLDAHERYESSTVLTIQFSLQVDPRYGDGVCEALRKENVSDLQRIYMGMGNHRLPPPQLPAPSIEERFPSSSKFRLQLVR